MMLFKQFYDEDLAQGSYFIGCQALGEAIVVDPRRDIAVYLAEAERQQMRIVAVTETHIHADYLSGSRELAHKTGATLYLSAEGGPDWQYAFEGVPLKSGSEITIGNIRVQAVHTPGHTPEHMSFLVTDGATTQEPGFLLSGDFVFVGDVGRPDLLDEAAGGVDTRFIGAQQMFASLRDHFLTLPDYVQVWPGHGAGSACGKALGAIASTTVGYERRFAWWADYVANGDLEGFTQALLAGQPDAPAYFGRMKRQNRQGPALLGERPALRPYNTQEVKQGLKTQQLMLVDTRSRDAYEAGYVPDALYVPWGGQMASNASYAIDPELDTVPLVLFAADEAQAEQMRDRLSYVGIDHVSGYITTLADFDKVPVEMVTPETLQALENPFILDVRTKNEFSEGHLPEAQQLHVGRVRQNLAGIPDDRAVLMYCQSGRRANIAASVVRAFKPVKVIELTGSYPGYKAWQDTQGLVEA